MHKNVNKYERALRFIGGAALVAYAIKKDNPYLLFGAVPMATGLTGSCPLYQAVDVSTRKEDRSSNELYFHKFH
ncbi:MAG: DUF2892 domain-containing protein [Bacteriovoracia bacterium]